MALAEQEVRAILAAQEGQQQHGVAASGELLGAAAALSDSQSRLVLKVVQSGIRGYLPGGDRTRIRTMEIAAAVCSRPGTSTFRLLVEQHLGDDLDAAAESVPRAGAAARLLRDAATQVEGAVSAGDLHPASPARRFGFLPNWAPGGGGSQRAWRLEAYPLDSPARAFAQHPEPCDAGAAVALSASETAAADYLCDTKHHPDGIPPGTLRRAVLECGQLQRAEGITRLLCEIATSGAEAGSRVLALRALDALGNQCGNSVTLRLCAGELRGALLGLCADFYTDIRAAAQGLCREMGIAQPPQVAEGDEGSESARAERRRLRRERKAAREGREQGSACGAEPAERREPLRGEAQGKKEKKDKKDKKDKKKDKKDKKEAKKEKKEKKRKGENEERREEGDADGEIGGGAAPQQGTREQCSCVAP